jgi:hypothetical protein
VRGEIERQAAEFHALSRQIDTVVIATTHLRTESEAPGFALRGGSESVATYASAMATVLFYLPAAVLWTGTILLAAITAGRLFRWVGKRWFAAKISQSTIAG